MSHTVGLTTWLDYVGTEYLDTFIKHGGAAVKFVSTEGGLSTSAVIDELRRTAQEHALVPISIDAATTKVHMVDHIFTECARQVPWPRLTEMVLRRFAVEEGFGKPSPLPADCGFAAHVASECGSEADSVKKQLTYRIHTDVYKDRLMARDFRYAMASMCKAQLSMTPQARGLAALVESWLTGDLQRISQLEPLSIFTKVNRSNARLLLESLMHWLRVAGLPGTLLTLDLSQVLEARYTEGLRYTKTSVLDSYEVLRQFIDGISDLEGVLFVVVGDERMLDPDRRQRGLAAYQALRNRVYDEVQDRAHPNPAGSLVRVATESAA